MSTRIMRIAASVLLALGTLGPGVTSAATPISIYGAWHCGDDACTWATVRDMTEFDTKNHWLIDRGDGRPSVNLVVLSFVNPLTLLNGTTNTGNTDGVPRGMTQAVVDYFTSHGIRVMLSIGGITYTDDWNTALAAERDPARPAGRRPRHPARRRHRDRLRAEHRPRTPPGCSTSSTPTGPSTRTTRPAPTRPPG